MDIPDLFALFVRPLHRQGLRYMVSGSLASVHYGEPRLTMDVDIVVHLDAAQGGAIGSAFPSVDYYVPPVDVILAELDRLTVLAEDLDDRPGDVSLDLVHQLHGLDDAQGLAVSDLRARLDEGRCVR